MTSTTPVFSSPVDVRPVTQGSVIGSEWFKLTTLASRCWWAMFGTKPVG